MITFYQRTDCPFCWKVRLALVELRLDYEVVDTQLGEKHPDVLRLSPTGTVPVLVDGDVAIWESGVMLDYLDQRYAQGALLPPGPDLQAGVRLIHAYSDKCIGPALRELVFEKRSKPCDEWDQELISRSEEAWRACQAYLETKLDQQWLNSGTLSAAECALAARCGVAEAYGADVDVQYTALHSWFQAVKLRPSWAFAYPESFPGIGRGQTTI